MYETVSSGRHWNHLMLPFLTQNNILGLILDEYTVEHLGSSYLMNSGLFQRIGKPYFSKEP